MLLPGGDAAEVPIYRFLDLRPGHRLSGPALVEYPGSTLFLPADWTVEMDEMLNARATRGEE